MRAQDQEPASTSRSQPRRAPTQAVGPAPVPLHPTMPLTPQAILRLQRTVGNAAVARLIEAQRREADGLREDNGQPVQRSTVPDVLRSPGRPLDDNTRTEMEARLGADFSDVRLHTDSAAQRSATEIGAAAYTSGNHIVTGADGIDKHTLAHELTHVIQQRSGPVAGTDNGAGLKVSDPSDRFEREAEATAQRAMAGHAVAGTHDPGYGSTARAHAGGPAVVQRIIRITPGMYMRGVGATEQTLTAKQLRQYLGIAVWDEAARADNYDTEGKEYGQQVAAIMKDLKNKTLNVPEGFRRATVLVGEVNTVLKQPNVNGSGSNANTRYATEPKSVYSHSSLMQPKTEEPYWGDDKTMREKIAQSLGPIVGTAPQKQPRLEEGNLPLTQLTLTQASTMLPRPLFNLIFDVRYQLEAPDAEQQQPVIDERSKDQKDRKDKSPNEPGTLRSWHQDDSGKLPDNQFNPDSVPEDARPLHDHYAKHSQSGAGSSVNKDPATAARGFAEYTGTGSNWEHYIKVVLDYINKRVYLTLTHYQYWALIPPEKSGDPYEFWQGPGQNLEDAQAQLEKHRRGASGIMMSPWLEITFS